MPELNITLDALTGAVLVGEPDRLPTAVLDSLAALLGPGAEMGCARPRTMLPPPIVAAEEPARSARVRVAGYVHNSLVEGPGRQTSAYFAGCTLGCRGCWVPDLHRGEAGTLVPVDRLADALLDPAHERDGVSILGGEPFQQPDGLLALVQALRARGCPHVLAYSGYTYERLRRMAERQPAVGAVLDEIDVLVDGPYVAALADSASPWTGSGNQRVGDTAAVPRIAAGTAGRWQSTGAPRRRTRPWLHVGSGPSQATSRTRVRPVTSGPRRPARAIAPKILRGCHRLAVSKIVPVGAELSLQRAELDAGDEVALQERVDDQNRQRRDQDLRRLHRPVRELGEV